MRVQTKVYTFEESDYWTDDVLEEVAEPEPELPKIPRMPFQGTSIILQSVKFKLSPISTGRGRNILGPPSIRTVEEGQKIKLGRKTTAANPDEINVWFTAKIISRSHCEIWLKDGVVT